MKRSILLITFLFFVLLVKAQDLEVKSISFSDPPIGFLGMAQDNYGYIWLTDNGNGLYKYDGNNSIIYKPEPANPNSPASGRIENVIIDKDGILWLAHFDSGLDRFDPETEIFTHFTHDDQDISTLCSNATRDIVEDLEGNLWVGTFKGLDKFDKKSGEFIHNFSTDPDAEILRNEHIRKLYIDKSGIIWIGTGSVFFGEETTGGLFSLNPLTGEINLYRHTDEENSLIDNRVRAIFEDSRGVFWVGTAGDGLHTMNREDGTFIRHTFDPGNPEKLSRPPIQNNFNFGVDHIPFIGEDEEGCIWIGTFGNGLNRYNPVTEITNHFGPNNSGEYNINISAYWGFLKTRDDLLWVSSFGEPSSLRFAKIDISPRKLKINKFNGIRITTMDGDGLIYFGTSDGVEQLKNGVRQYLFKTNNKQDQNTQTVREISFDNEGNIWAGTVGGGIYYYNIQTKDLVNYRHEPGNRNSLSNDFIGSILVQENGEIFIGTSDGLDILNPESNNFEHFEIKNTVLSEFSYQRPKYVSVDGKNRIWVGGEGGIFKFDRTTGKFKKYELGSGNEIVLDLYRDADGVVWVGTINHGLRRYNDESDLFEPVLDETGYLNKYSYVSCIGQDKNGTIWFSIEYGMVRYDLQSNQGTFYGDDWIPDNNRYRLQGILTLPTGEILISAFGGYIKFHPDDFLRAESDISKPFIEKIYINNKILTDHDYGEKYNSLHENSFINLSYDQNDLNFQVGYIDYENNQGAQSIAYKLENYDKEWRHVLSGNLISYYQLSPDQYNLLIRAQDIYGNWGEKSISITISPPWYFRWWAYVLYGMAIITGIILIDRIQRKRLLKKAMAEAKEKELKQAREIEKAYNDLKSTQSQLIQSEKMASLGELTAGIAHEIQNPLNFVNNFSEVNSELVEELKDEIKNGNLEEIESIANDIKENEEKIKHHGQRAENIVKGMLQHSRSSNGKKEPTDINAMADEYLRLAYHGLRAKDKSFNADFKTEFDEALPKINVISQDIGRVLLNLINNAFYAVDKKAKEGIEGYKPLIEVSTKMLEDSIEISVKDNGEGIPAQVREKIFQPFFTTKPTGQGTGLGLSLSYDIVKAHGGELKVETKEGEGTIFNISIPLN